MRGKIHQLLQRRTPTQDLELPCAIEEGRKVFLQPSGASNINQELGGPKSLLSQDFFKILDRSDSCRNFVNIKKTPVKQRRNCSIENWVV